MTISKPQVLDELRRVKGPDLQGNIVDLGLVSEILVKDDRVYFSITVPAARAEELEPLRQAAETVVAKAREMAAEIALGSPLSLALTRRAIQQGLTGSLESAMEFEGFALDQCYSSPEHKEYVSAFLEKRKPDLTRIRK